MNNRNIQTAWQYHDGTKHSYWNKFSALLTFLDWCDGGCCHSKMNPCIESYLRCRETFHKQAWLLCRQSLSRCPHRHPIQFLTLQDLARILYFSAGNYQNPAPIWVENSISRRRLHRALNEIEPYAGNGAATGDLKAWEDLLQSCGRIARSFGEKVTSGETWPRPRRWNPP